jgi:hypothetical protein
MSMKCGGRTFVITLGWIAVACGALRVLAVTPDGDTNGGQPYGAIVERNVFALTPAPIAPPIDTSPPAPPPPNLTLVGLSSVFGLQAFILIKPQARPGQPQTNVEETVIMSLGDRRGAVELLAVDVKGGTARIRNDGAESTLAIRTNSPSHGAGGMVAGGATGRPMNYTPQGQPGFPSPAQGGGAAGYNPAGNSGAGQPQSNWNPNNSGQGNPSTPNYGMGIPSRDVRTDQAAPQQIFSPDEQTLLIEAQRQEALSRGDSIATILPPTEMSPGNQNDQQTPQPTGGSPNPNQGPAPFSRTSGTLSVPR